MADLYLIPCSTANIIPAILNRIPLEGLHLTIGQEIHKHRRILFVFGFCFVASFRLLKFSETPN